MTEHDRKVMLNLADTLKGEINRICVTKDLQELNNMELFAGANLKKLYLMRIKDLSTERE